MKAITISDRNAPRLRRTLTVAAMLLAGLCADNLHGQPNPAIPDREMRERRRAEIFSQKLDLTDDAKRAEVVRQLRELDDAREADIRARARARGIPTEGDKPGGGRFVLVDFDADDLPVFEQTENVNAAISTAAHQVRATAPYNVNGSNVLIGLWEAGGIPRGTHQEITGRVTVLDGATTITSHATHVAGTLIASGINASTRGMAPLATIAARNSTSDETEMTAAGAAAPNTAKVYLSNHSYGSSAGWEDDVWNGSFSDDGIATNDVPTNFGQYSTGSRDWDSISASLPYYQIFISAGNHRDDAAPSSGGTWYASSSPLTARIYDPAQHPLGDGVYKNGYDSMEGNKLAKNVISVGAVNDAVSGGNRSVSAATPASFTSWGPADDGRIKPDIVANGTSLISSDYTSATATASLSGTSMASPNACGSAALLIEYFRDRFPGSDMRASTLKALLIHTADDRGNAGPDYQYGWGLMNTKAAADVIKAHADNNGGATMIESSVSTTVTSRTHVFGWNGSSPLRVTLVWTDPAGTAKSGHDDRTRALVNDLNLVVTGPGDVNYFPYVMPHVGVWTTATLDDVAITGTNTVDNVEQVYRSTPVAGTYYITVNYSGSLSGGSQNYSLIVSGQTPAEISVDNNGPPLTTLADNSGTVNFGQLTPTNPPAVRTFTLRNLGGSPLTGLNVAKDGAHAADFAVSSLTATNVNPGTNLTFTVTFNHAAPGQRNAALHITSNDTNESPFDINLTGTRLTALESWRLACFGSTNNSGAGADTNNFDGDVAVNLVEFGLATDPKVVNPLPVSFAVVGGAFEYTYQRNKAALGELTYGVVWTDNLPGGSWSSSGVTESILSDNGSVQMVKATIPLGPTGQRYVTLRITKN